MPTTVEVDSAGRREIEIDHADEIMLEQGRFYISQDSQAPKL